MPTLRICSPCVIECDVTVIVYCAWLKCQLSGDALQDSRSLLNSIKSNPECFVLLIQIPYPLQIFDPRDQDCILAKRTGIWSFDKILRWIRISQWTMAGWRPTICDWTIEISRMTSKLRYFHTGGIWIFFYVINWPDFISQAAWGGGSWAEYMHHVVWLSRNPTKSAVAQSQKPYPKVREIGFKKGGGAKSEFTFNLHRKLIFLQL